jgi:ATP-binding cassette subfamily F protein uup
MPAARNLVNLKDVTKGYSSRTILAAVTLGIEDGDRVGVVGRNGDGKSTLLRLLTGAEQPDAGKVTRAGDVRVAFLGQRDDLPPDGTIRELLIGDHPQHEWAGDARCRAVLDGLLGGIEPGRFANGLDTRLGTLSGGERRRIALAETLLENAELLVLDEPTNHLDVEGVDWLARHIRGRPGSLIVVTHDRWFLDEVCQTTWEVVDGTVHRYDGGYAAYVLARAERDRQETARNTRRRQLIRKELAWLRRGPPARTTKPKFRVDAANALIADEPPLRNTVELVQFATQRLGNRVIDAIDVTFGFGDKRLLDQVTWRLGPADRLGLVGVNGAGKTTLLRLLAGELQPGTGSVKRGLTVHVAHFTQDAAEMRDDRNVLETLEESRLIANVEDGRQVTAAMLCDRFGFRGVRARTPVGELSGGERRRLQLMRLLMQEPNVLLLDEPTNDLDIETLTALEDLLDEWPGTLVVVSHDRYFVERVCDNVHGLMGDGQLRHLPGGIEQYVQARRTAHGEDERDPRPPRTGERELTPGAALLAARKERRQTEKQLRRVERELDRVEQRAVELAEAMEAAATDHERLSELQTELAEVNAERERLEGEWLATSEALENRDATA